MGLTKKQQVFVDEYLKCWNASEAARRAGYSIKTCAVIGQENLTKPYIAAIINARLAEIHMSANEALQEIGKIGRGDMGEFLDVHSMGFNLNLREAQEKGLTPLIKKIKQKTTIFMAKKESDEDREVHEIEIELYDKQRALETIAKHHGVLKEQVDITSGGEKIIVTIKGAEDE